MALTHTIISTSTYGGRHMKVELTQTPNDAENKSKIDWTLTTYGGSSDYYSTGPTTLNIGGTIVYQKPRVDYSEHTFPAAKGSVSGSLTVSHATDGTKKINVSLKTAIYYAKVIDTWDTWTLDSITPYARITSAPNFTNAQNPKVSYSNPLGNSVTSLQMAIKTDASTPSVVCSYRDISKTGTSYTFNFSTAERTALVNLLGTTARSKSVRFYIKTVVNNNTYEKYTTKTFTLAGNPPDISGFVVLDTDSVTASLTSDSANTLVRFKSNAYYSTGATAHDGATISSVSVTNGSQTLKTTTGTINDVTSGTFKVTAVDSRGLVSTQEFTKTLVPYVKLTCSIKSVTTTNAATGTIQVIHGGDQFVGKFGSNASAVTNDVKRAVLYRPTGGGFDWVTVNVSSPKNSNTTNITLNRIHPTGGSEQSITDGYKREWEVKAVASDSIYTTAIGSAVKVVSFQPIFYWGKDNFYHNTPLTVLDNTLPTIECHQIKIAKTESTTDSQTVTFKNIYKSRPTVQVTYISNLSSGYSDYYIFAAPFNISTSGCTIMLRRNHIDVGKETEIHITVLGERDKANPNYTGG